MVANELSMTLVCVIGAAWSNGHQLARRDERSNRPILTPRRGFSSTGSTIGCRSSLIRIKVAANAC